MVLFSYLENDQSPPWSLSRWLVGGPDLRAISQFLCASSDEEETVLASLVQTYGQGTFTRLEGVTTTALSITGLAASRQHAHTHTRTNDY